MRVLFAVNSPKKVYSYVRQALEEGNRVDYLSTQSSANLTNNLSNFWSDVASYVKSNQLSIRSAYDYFPGGTQKKAKNSNPKIPSPVKKSIVILCPAAVSAFVKLRLYESHQQSETIGLKANSIAYLETFVGSKFSGSTIVCCVFGRFVQSLDIVSLLHLMKNHELAIGGDGRMIPLSEDDIVDALRKGMESVMGQGSSTLVLKSLQFVYHIGENDILANPSACFEKFEKMLGGLTTDKIRSAASREIRKLISQQDPLGTALQN